MFEVKFVLKHDKHLGDVLRYLKPLSLEPPVVEPLEDVVMVAQMTKAPMSGLEPRAAAGVRTIARNKAGIGKLSQVAKEWLDKQPNLVRFVPEQLTPTLTDLGFAKGSIYYAIKSLIAAGRVKKGKGRGNYEVIRKK